eukprot:15439872-Alexandrium_andersonii.AAC.2
MPSLPGKDQRFAVVGSTLARQMLLETPLQFADAIRERVHPVRGRNMQVQMLTAARDWKEILKPLALQFHGHTGPDSVHALAGSSAVLLCLAFCVVSKRGSGAKRRYTNAPEDRDRELNFNVLCFSSSSSGVPPSVFQGFTKP